MSDIEKKQRKRPETLSGKTYNEYYREKMKDYYKSGKGKLRAVVYRLNKLHDNDEEIKNIINQEVCIDEKIRQLQLFHFNKKFSK